MNGFQAVRITPQIRSVEWDIYQISVQTTSQNDACTVEIHWNNYFLCGSNQGFKDCATGPPDVIVGADDTLLILWSNVNLGDVCQASIWYNENPAGTTYSTAH